MSPKQFVRRSLSILLLASVALGCRITVHNYGDTSPKGGKGGSSQAPGASKGTDGDKPKGEEPDRPKGDKPDKPKGDKPDQPKGDKPDKPKGDKPQAGKPGDKPSKPDKPKDPKPGDAPEDPAKPPSKPSEPPPPPGVSRLTVPVRAPFEDVVQKVEALLPKTQSQDWERMGKEGDSTVLDVKYKVWRDPVEAKFKGRTLTLVVPVRYAADIKGKVKNPFGSDYLPLNDGQTWGTKSSPQRLRLTVNLELDVNDEWKLVSVAKLERIEHGPPPKGNFCAHAGIDFCTPKENLAGEVHKSIERQLSPRIMKELEKAERELQKNLDLRAQASALWAAVQKPLQLQKKGDKACATVLLSACKDDAWLVFEPTSFGLSELSVVDGDFGIDVGLEGKLAVVSGKKPKAGTQKLPKPAKLPGATAFQLRVWLTIPTAVLDASIKKELSSLDLNKSSLQVTKVRALAVKGDLRISIETKGAYEGSLALSATPVFDEKKREIRFERVELEPESKKVLEQQVKGVDAKALTEAVKKALYIPVGKEMMPLRRAFTRALDGALPGQLEVRGSLDQLEYKSVDVEGGDVLHLTIELSGSLNLEYSL